MSIRYMLAAMEMRVGNHARARVLLKLCDNANDEGLCWPSLGVIAKHCEMSRRTVIRHINQMVEDGLIDKIHRTDKSGRSTSNAYQIKIIGEGVNRDTGRVTGMTPRGDNSDTHEGDRDDTLQGDNSDTLILESSSIESSSDESVIGIKNPKSCSGPKAAAAPAPDPGAGLALVNGSKEVVPKALNVKIKAEAKTGAIWAAYAAAYVNRYGVEPVRNAKINGQLAQIIDRLGADEAPHVAACYVGSNNAFYVSRRHSVDCLLRDCESLRTEWATGARMSVTEARQMDEHESTYESVRWVRANMDRLRKLRAEGKI